jgi:hypothetical protein
MQEAVDADDVGTRDEIFREISRLVPVQGRIRAVLEDAVRDDPKFDGRSGTLGFLIGLTSAHLHLEWAQAMFGEIHPTESDREAAAQAYRMLVDRLPITVEQEAQI